MATALSACAGRATRVALLDKGATIYVAGITTDGAWALVEQDQKVLGYAGVDPRRRSLSALSLMARRNLSAHSATRSSDAYAVILSATRGSRPSCCVGSERAPSAGLWPGQTDEGEAICGCGDGTLLVTAVSNGAIRILA